MSNALHDAALAYCDRGWSVIPLANKRQPHFDWFDFKFKRPTKENINEWWTKWPEAFIGLVLGPISGVIRIDVDGDAALSKMQELGGMPSTMEFRSPGGHGWLFKDDVGCVPNETVWSGPGQHEEIRILSEGHYTVLPPSPGYSWVNGDELARFPEWVHQVALGKALSRLAREQYPDVPYTLRDAEPNVIKDALRRIPAVDYTTWRNVGFALHHVDMYDEWVEWSQTCPEKFSLDACEKLWQRMEKRDDGITPRFILFLAREFGWRGDCHEELTDLGNATILSRRAEGKLLHSSELGWYAWDEVRWVNGGDAYKFASRELFEVLKYRVSAMNDSLYNFSQSVKRMAASDDDLDEKKIKDKLKAKLKFLNLIKSHENIGHINGALECASRLAALSVDYRALNRHPLLLNCQNGTLDLETMKLREHNPKDLITQVTTANYSPTAAAPRWELFIREVFVDPELIEWVHKLMGYCITGVVDLHVLPILFGSGRNGKSTLIKTMIAVLGHEYAGTTPSNFLTMTRDARNADAASPSLMKLFGKRFMADMETGDGMKLNEELVKRLTGGDAIDARPLYGDLCTFQPTHKLFVATNYEPAVQGTDDAIWGRVLKVPFTESFLGREEPGLDDKLLSERDGILRWLVQGCARWRAEGLRPYPQAVVMATQEYRTDQDTIVRFFEEKLTIDATADVPKSAVIAIYNVWCSSNKLKQCSSKMFGSSLKKWYAHTVGRELLSDKAKYKGIKIT